MFLTVKKLVQAGELGEVVEYETRFDRCRLDAKRGLARERRFPAAGVLWDLGPHVIDGALVLFGPRTTWASAFCQRETSGERLSRRQLRSHTRKQRDEDFRHPLEIYTGDAADLTIPASLFSFVGLLLKTALRLG